MKSFSVVRIFAITYLSFSAFISAGVGDSPIYFEFGTGISANSGENSAPDFDLSSSDKKFTNKTSVPLSASIGYRFSPNMRFDLNTTYLPEWNVNLQGKDSEGDQISLKSSISSLSTGLNLYYDFTYFDNLYFIPYLTGGIGISINKVGDSDLFIKYNSYNTLVSTYSSNNTTNFMWKVGAGLTKKINESLFVDFSYKFVSLGKAKSKSGSVVEERAFFYNEESLKFKKLYSNQFLINMGFNF